MELNQAEVTAMTVKSGYQELDAVPAGTVISIRSNRTVLLEYTVPVGKQADISLRVEVHELQAS